MKLLKARVNWAEGFSNDPSLEILVDKMPELKDLSYKNKGSLYYAELDGSVSFFHYAGPGNGFGGRSFTIQMENGEEKILQGPWSSNASSMNEAGFGPCLDVSIIDDLASYERGYTFYSGHVTIDLIEQSKHLVEIGPGYNKRCGCGCIKEQECFIEFPKGSTFALVRSYGFYNPAVLLPDGKTWVKNDNPPCVYDLDLSADQLRW